MSNIVSVKEAADITGAHIRGIYKKVEDGILTKYSVISKSGRKLTAVDLDEVLTRNSGSRKQTIISAYEAAKKLGITYNTLVKKLEAGTIPSYNIIGKNGNQVLGVNWEDFSVNNINNIKTESLVFTNFNLDDALDGLVTVIHSSGEEVIEVVRLESDVRNNVVYVKKNGFVDVCNEEGKFGDQQVLFFKGRKMWANVYRDEWNDYIVDDERFDTEERAVKVGSKISTDNNWTLVSTILLKEAEFK